MKREIYIGLALLVGVITFLLSYLFSPDPIHFGLSEGLPVRIYLYGLLPCTLLLIVTLFLCIVNEKIDKWFN